MTFRWDLLLETKPVPLVDHLLEEVAKLLAKDLATWPPPVVEVDPSTGAAAAKVLSDDALAPPAALYPAAFHLADLELGRELEAFDDYLRNRRYLAAGLTEAHRPALLFLTRWLVEQMLALGEATEGRVSRRAMRACLERAQRRRQSPGPGLPSRG